MQVEQEDQNLVDKTYFKVGFEDNYNTKFGKGVEDSIKIDIANVDLLQKIYDESGSIEDEYEKLDTVYNKFQEQLQALNSNANDNNTVDNVENGEKPAENVQENIFGSIGEDFDFTDDVVEEDKSNKPNKEYLDLEAKYKALSEQMEALVNAGKQKQEEPKTNDKPEVTPKSSVVLEEIGNDDIENFVATLADLDKDKMKESFAKILGKISNQNKALVEKITERDQVISQFSSEEYLSKKIEESSIQREKRLQEQRQLEEENRINTIFNNQEARFKNSKEGKVIMANEEYLEDYKYFLNKKIGLAYNNKIKFEDVYKEAYKDLVTRVNLMNENKQKQAQAAQASNSSSSFSSSNTNVNRSRIEDNPHRREYI